MCWKQKINCLIQLSDIKKIYFVGIGGIGMSALARYFAGQKVQVSGYDKTSTSLTDTLQNNGIAVSFSDEVETAPKDVQLVVYTPAIPQDHPQLQYYRQQGYPVLKRSEVLELVSTGSFNICVAGTHGKTTISTMIAQILRHSEYGCNAFLGGISVNYNTNFWSNERNICVIEADEYDRSFLRLHPNVAIVSAMDADHLDIYGTEENLQNAFVDFTRKLKPGGLLITRAGLKRSYEMQAGQHLTYSLDDAASDVYAANITIRNGGYQFDAVLKDKRITGISLHMGGMHNVENSLAAIAVANSLGIAPEKIVHAVSEFKGVKRRFETIAKTDKVTYIDDYAHHPEELKALLNSTTQLFEGRNCTIVFQPHLFSRTKDFADEFATSLDIANHVILLPIYPARETPVEGVSSEMILERIKNPNKSIMTKPEFILYLEKQYLPSLHKDRSEVLITAGAGDIDALVAPIKEMITGLQ